MLYSTSRAVLLAGLLFSLVACSGGSGSSSGSDTSGAATLPQLNLTADSRSVMSGSTATLTWSSNNVETCRANGGWEGIKATSGSETTGPLTGATDFTLACDGPSGSITRTFTVNIASDLAVDLRVSADTISTGDRVELTWSSSAAEQCTASGAWTGNLPVNGSQLSEPLTTDSTFSLTCSNAAGSAIAMASISIASLLKLSWQAPTENVDGSPLTDLSSYRVYYGLTSRNYTATTDIDDPSTSSISIPIAPGSYYVALTAIDADGNESGYSNEIFKATE